MPEDENALGLEHIFCLVDVLGEVLSVVLHFGPHVVHHEWLREVVSVVRKRHRSEVESHGRSALEVSELVVPGRSVAVRVEKLRNRLTVFREVRVVGAFVEFLIEVVDVVCIRREQGTKLFICKHGVENHDFIHGGLSALISDASGRG